MNDFEDTNQETHQTKKTPAPPTIERRSSLPLGNIPKHRMPIVMVAIACAIILMVALSGPSATDGSKAQAARPVVANPTSQMTVDDYRRKLAEEESRLKLAQQQAERAKIDYASLNAAEQRGGIPGETVQRNGQVYYPATGGYDRPEPVDPIEAARKKREYDSLFASNLALSYRPKEETATAPTPMTTQQPAVRPAASNAGEKQETKPSAGDYTLMEGTILEAVLVNRLEGSFVGPVNTQITTDVYSRDGLTLLIPKGSRVLGEAKQVADQNQRRLAVFFHRLIMPDGYSVNLDQMPGLDQAGAAALKDKVNHHYLATFGTSIMLGLLAGFSMYGTQGVYQGGAEDIYRQGVANQLSRDAGRILERQLNRMPDITIREGHYVRIMLSGDLALPGYSQHPPAVL